MNSNFLSLSLSFSLSLSLSLSVSLSLFLFLPLPPELLSEHSNILKICYCPPPAPQPLNKIGPSKRHMWIKNRDGTVQAIVHQVHPIYYCPINSTRFISLILQKNLDKKIWMAHRISHSWQKERTQWTEILRVRLSRTLAFHGDSLAEKESLFTLRNFLTTLFHLFYPPL